MKQLVLIFYFFCQGILSLSNPQSRKQLYPDERRRIHKRQVQSVYSGSTAFRPGFRMQFLQNNNLSPGFSNYIGLQPSVEKAQEEAQTEDFMREKIREYYALRTGEAKKRWMYKPSKGTSKHIREIFLGRCWYFVQQKDSGLVNPESVNCNELWEAFSKAFAYKKPCNVTEEDYRPFFELYREAPIYNKVMLWSGTKDWAHAYTHLFKRYVTLDDTLAGYTLNHVNWCGSEEWPGIDFKSCPYECSKQMAFWGNAAKNLASRARGVVHILLNGTRQHFIDRQIFPAFMDDSFLALNQLPNLSPRDVTEVKILVGHTLHHKKLERCNTLSIKELQNQSTARGLKTSCYDDPFVIRHLLCADQPLDPLCLFKTIPQADK
ncbi:ADP-ribosyl cyclase/cyclic ADP-ribose hydrolase [Nematostella vectensis]|uniref:ADP-ribosyl cyclase/cyclic ADP-ribose hydrolase n=1 Tax=Nematostella vectensis TaxID=45351 RepID=UPI0020777DC9|nr:ADP-ribosyl cyclase/cyclic ADP-ribose hydrolase [Nematostella vectensis]